MQDLDALEQRLRMRKMVEEIRQARQARQLDIVRVFIYGAATAVALTHLWVNL